MMVLGINYILKSVQIIAGGRRYICPIKESGRELYFRFRNEWHKVMDFISEFTVILRFLPIIKVGRMIYDSVKLYSVF